MTGNNEIAQLVKLKERMQARMDKSEKKMELMATFLQNFMKKTPKEDSEKPHNEKGKGDRKGEVHDWNREKRGKYYPSKLIHD